METTLQTSLNNAALKFGVNIDWNSADIASYIENVFNRFVGYYTTAYTIVIVIFASMALISIGILLWILISSKNKKDNLFYKNIKLCNNPIRCSTYLCDCLKWICLGILVISFVVLLCAVPVFIKLKTIPEAVFVKYLM